MVCRVCRNGGGKKKKGGGRGGGRGRTGEAGGRDWGQAAAIKVVGAGGRMCSGNGKGTLPVKGAPVRADRPE